MTNGYQELDRQQRRKDCKVRSLSRRFHSTAEADSRHWLHRVQELSLHRGYGDNPHPDFLRLDHLG